MKKEIKSLILHIIIGALLGFLFLHPVSMYISDGKSIMSLYSKDQLLHYLTAPMAGYFTLIGIILGLISGISQLAIQRKNIILKKQKSELYDLNTTKDKFFSIIAHDLKSPFNALLGLSELLFNDYESFDDKTKKKFIKLIYESILNIYKLLENLLVWSRSQSGKMELNPSIVNLRELVDENIFLFDQNIVSKRISLKSEIINDYFITTDRDIINTVVRNLISNAIKFTPITGKISIAAQVVQGEHQNESIEISVKDTGIGIAPENIVTLFKIEADYTTLGTEGEKGTGLGLILCKEFIEELGGSICVESEIGKGSVFKFTIPKKTEIA